MIVMIPMQSDIRGLRGLRWIDNDCNDIADDNWGHCGTKMLILMGTGMSMLWFRVQPGVGTQTTHLIVMTRCPMSMRELLKSAMRWTTIDGLSMKV